MEYKPGQLLELNSGFFTINKVTEKALMIECSDGKWGGDGFKPLWIPKSIIKYIEYDDSKDRSQFGTHKIDLPNWFKIQNKKLI